MSSQVESKQPVMPVTADPSATPFDSGQDRLGASLQVYLLGPPEVTWAGHPLSIPRRQTRALLYCLAVRPESVPREQLCFLFWPDIPESKARFHLSRLLTHLRRALPAPELLLTAGDTVSLDPQRVWSDVVAFERGGTHLIPHALHPFPPPAEEKEDEGDWSEVQHAVDLYRGPFLAGFSLPGSPEYETWVTQERRALERSYLEVLAALMEELAARSEWEAAIACARRYLATDELAEGVHRRLIEILAVSGDRSGALRQFERCVAILERELGVSPLPETRAAYLAVLQGSTPTRPPAPSKPWTTLPTLDAPLIGREDALAQLEQAYSLARAGRGEVVLISGEPGIGKSRLLQDFAGEVPSQATLVIASSHEAEQDVPYAPLVEALRPLVPSLDWQHCAVPPFHLSEIARLLPELRTRLPDLPEPGPITPGGKQVRLFEALSCWLRALAADRPPLVLCLDDLHWADEATLAWLSYFAREMASAPVLVLGTRRSGESGKIAALRSELRRRDILREVRLEGLTQGDVLHLVRSLSGQTVAAGRFGERLHRETGGNPFFLLETLRAMFEAGLLRQDERGWSTAMDGSRLDDRQLPLPDTVQQAIRDRLRRLPPQTRQVLEAAAVIGHRFDLDLVQKTSGRQESEVVDALDQLVARQVISEQEGGYHFNHDLIRAVVQGDLSYGRRRLLHRRAGEALEERRPDDVAALAWHFECAEELAKAARYALQAGNAAKNVFAYVEARAQFDRALAALTREAARLRDPQAIAANRRQRIQALDGRGWAFRLLGDMQAYARDSQEVARLARLLGDQATLAHLRWREAYAHRWFCQYDKASQAAAEGVRLSQVAGDLYLEARCWREVGMAARETGRYQEAQDALERALSLFVKLNQTVYEVHTLGNLSTLFWYTGEYQRAMDMARRALARCEEAALPLQRRLPLGDMGVAAAAMGDFDRARQCLTNSLAIARQIADRTQEILCLGHLGWLHVQLKQPAQALQHLEAALVLAQRVGSCTEQSWLLSGLAEARRLAGDRARAGDCARRALELARETGRVRDEQIARHILQSLSAQGKSTVSQQAKTGHS